MGLLDTANTADNGDVFVDDARVMFTDGTDAAFDRVEFVSDGRLKATLVTSIDVGGSLAVPVTNIVHYASGSWKSVQESPRGCLIALVLPAGQPIGGESTWVVEASIRGKGRDATRSRVDDEAHARQRNRCGTCVAGSHRRQ